MYTVGQVAKFLGISRDTLKFYEEKNLITPMQDEENGYRKYNILDIYEVTTVNFYRDIDIEIKNIQELKKNENVNLIESILHEKEQKIKEDIEYKKLLLKRIETIKENCESIKVNLNNFTIREMKPIVVTDEIKKSEDITEIYGEILEKYDCSARIKKPVNLYGISRVVYFNSEAVTKERYVLYEKLEEEIHENGEVVSYDKCIYTVVAIPVNSGEVNIDGRMAASITETAKELGYETLGIAFINLLINGYENGQNIQYLEIYVPVK